MHRNEQEYLVEKIRTQYTRQEHTELEALTALDRKVKRPADTFAWVFGTLSALILGCGMSLVMTDIGQVVGVKSPMLPGIVVGLVGLVMSAVNYPIYRRLLERRRKQYAQEIISLSDSILRG